MIGTVSVFLLLLYIITKKHVFMALFIICILLIPVYYGSRKLKEKYIRNKLRKIARDTIETMNNNDINYWTDYGTLLGIYRENDIIEHDNDCDFCLKQSPDLYRKMLNVANDLRVLDKNYYLEYHPWGAYRIKNGFLFADLYLITEKDNLYIDPTGQISKDLVEPISSINWNGLNVKVPHKVHETLLYRYGNDFMTPKRF